MKKLFKCTVEIEVCVLADNVEDARDTFSSSIERENISGLVSRDGIIEELEVIDDLHYEWIDSMPYLHDIHEERELSCKQWMEIIKQNQKEE